MSNPNEFDYEDDGPDDEDDYDAGEECGRWRNGRLAPYSECLQAGTEFCDWECPYARSRQASPLCSDCPPIGYPTDITRCSPCPRRADGHEGRTP